MPTRIKPVYDLWPCILTLDSIKGIAELVSRNFQESLFSAHEKAWEVYDEAREPFLLEISHRETLDSFVVEAKDPPTEVLTEKKQIRLVFNDREAKLTFTADPKHQDWFEHFMIDLRKYVRPAVSRRFLAEVLGSLASGSQGVYGSLNPYCRITIRKKQPSPFIENIKANLVSNLIWLVLGIIFTLIVQWILAEYGFDLNPFD